MLTVQIRHARKIRAAKKHLGSETCMSRKEISCWWMTYQTCSVLLNVTNIKQLPKASIEKCLLAISVDATKRPDGESPSVCGLQLTF